MVSVMMMDRAPPKQMSEMASVRNSTISVTNVENVSPRTWNSGGRSSSWMKKRAAMAGMIMFASISASERSPAAATRKRRL